MDGQRRPCCATKIVLTEALSRSRAVTFGAVTELLVTIHSALSVQGAHTELFPYFRQTVLQSMRKYVTTTCCTAHQQLNSPNTQDISRTTGVTLPRSAMTEKITEKTHVMRMQSDHADCSIQFHRVAKGAL
jgi:hypothetical protein